MSLGNKKKPQNDLNKEDKRIDRTSVRNGEERQVWVQAGPVRLEGNLSLPAGAGGMVLFAHGSGSNSIG